MLSGAIFSAAATVGTAVFRIVVSSDSMKNATATSHGTRRLMGSPPPVGAELAGAGPIGAELVRMSAPLTSGRSYVGNSFIGAVRLSPPRIV